MLQILLRDVILKVATLNVKALRVSKNAFEDI